jgi:hypothetical protein
MDVVTLKGLPDADYAKLLQNVSQVKTQLDNAAAEKAAAEQAERDRIEKQRLEQEEKELALQRREKELQDKLDKIAQEEARQLLARNQARAKSLEGLGMTFSQSSQVFQYGSLDAGRVTLPIGTVTGLEDELWAGELATITDRIKEMKDTQAKADADRKELEEKRAELERRNTARITELKALGFVFAHGDYVKRARHDRNGEVTVQQNFVKESNPETWEGFVVDLKKSIAEQAEEDNKEDKRLAEEAEAERVAGLNDGQKIREYLDKVTAAAQKAPTLKTKKAKDALANYHQALSAAAKAFSAIK